MRPLPDNQHIQFTQSLKFVGSTITFKLNEDAKAKALIGKAKSLIGAAKHFFNNKDVDIRTKHNIYNPFAIDATLWGCELWNLSHKKTIICWKPSTTALSGGYSLVLSLKFEMGVLHDTVHVHLSASPSADLYDSLWRSWTSSPYVQGTEDWGANFGPWSPPAT